MSIAVGIIAKNEERDLPRALASVNSVADFLIVVDTGSTDKTVQLARDAGAHVETYTDASIQDNGEWLLQDFSRARNRAIEMAERTGAEWYLWLDADDEMKTPDVIRQATALDADCFTVWIESGGPPRWIQHRMWRTRFRVRFAGRCHEYPIIDGLRIGQLDTALIAHHADLRPGDEPSIARNLRLLMLEWADEPTARTAFYIGNTYRDAGQHHNSIAWYWKRILAGEGFRDEWLFAHLYLIRALRECGAVSGAALLAQKGMALAPEWMEFRLELVKMLTADERYQDAIDTALPAIDAPIPPTVLWREEWAYREGPLRLIAHCCQARIRTGAEAPATTTTKT